MGDDTVSNRAIPTAVVKTGILAGKIFVKVATGEGHTLALSSDGLVYAWGANGQGQLGDGSTATRTTPVQVLGLTEITDISAGSNSLAVDSAGRVWAWGANDVGQIGDGSHTNRSTPVQVSLPVVQAISCGGRFNLALTTAGKIYAWGFGGAEGGLLGTGEALAESTTPLLVEGGALVGKTVTKISAGVRHSLALTSDNSLVAWGRNFERQLGVGSLPPFQTALAPVLVSDGGSIAAKTVTQIAAGYDFSIALDSVGGLHAWGDNGESTLGLGDTAQRDFPTAIPSAGNPLAGRSVVSISAGVAHVLVLTSDNSIISWGANGSGQLGQNDFTFPKSTPALVTIPTALAGRPLAQVVSSSSSYSSALVTTVIPLTATTLPATSVFSTSAVLSATVNATEDQSSTPTFLYGPNAECAQGEVTAFPMSVTLSSPTAVDAVLSGLMPGTTYYFRVKSVDSGGSTALGSVLTFATNPLPPAPTVTTLPATQLGPFSEQLNGLVNPNGDYTTYFFRFRKQNPDGSYGTWSTTYHPPVDGTSDITVSGYAFLSALSGVTYQFQIEATNSGGTSTGDILTFVTPDPPSPPVLVTQAADNLTSTSARLHGTVTPNLSDTFVSFELGTDTDYGIYVPGPTSPFSGNTTQAVQATATDLLPNTTYHYRIVGFSGITGAQGNDMTFTTPGPGVTALSEWRLAAFGSAANAGSGADDADPDGDGMKNLLEFAIGSDPNAFTPNPPIVIDGDFIQYAYQRNLAATGLIAYQVEWWDGVVGEPWSSTGVIDEPVSEVGTVQQRLATLPKGTAGKRLVRLRVTTIP